MLKQFVVSVNPVFEALTGARSNILNNIREVSARRPPRCTAAHMVIVVRSWECCSDTKTYRPSDQWGYRLCQATTWAQKPTRLCCKIWRQRALGCSAYNLQGIIARRLSTLYWAEWWESQAMLGSDFADSEKSSTILSWIRSTRMLVSFSFESLQQSLREETCRRYSRTLFVVGTSSNVRQWSWWNATKKYRLRHPVMIFQLTMSDQRIPPGGHLDE